jgi:hypothetical protein
MIEVILEAISSFLAVPALVLWRLSAEVNVLKAIWAEFSGHIDVEQVTLSEIFHPLLAIEAALVSGNA